MKKTSAKVIHVTNILAFILSCIAAIIVPLGYYVLVYEYQAAEIETDVEAEAAEASQMISTNPEYWQFEQHRLEEFLSHRSLAQHKEIRRILDTKNSIITENADNIKPPFLTRSHDLFDSGMRIARLEVSRSLRPLLARTLLLLVAGLFLGVGMFIFLRKFPLKALSQALQSLQESEGKFRAIASTAADAIIVMDNYGCITYWNSAAEKMFGYTLDEALGKELHLLIAPDRYRDAYKIGLNKFMTSRKSAVRSALEFEAIRKDGSEFPIEVSTSTISVSHESHSVGIVRDISERKRTELELLKLEKLESLGVLAGGLAHDFNNVLTVMMGNISLAMIDTTPESSIRKRLINLGEAVVRAQNLTRQLLTFAKGGAPVKKTVHIGPVIEESCRFSLSGSKVNCGFFFAEDLQPADIDTGQIGQVMHNLVLNAAEAMPEGGKIEVRAANVFIGPAEGLPLPSGPYLRVSVRDEGVGIAQKNVSKIFDPYFTTKEKGSGLGLATSFSIIKRHGGYITVETVQGKGSLFHVYIPASSGIPSAHDSAKETPAGGRGKILVMDDEKTFRLVVGEILKTIGYEYELAKDGTEAIELYRSAREAGRPFDAVIMDLTVPGGVGGREAVKKLIELDPEVKAIVASGYSNDPVMADFKAYGFVGVIEKPFDVATLNRTLRSVL